MRVTRKHFLRFALLAAVGAVATEGGAAFLLFFKAKKVGAFGGKIVAGRVEDFPVGSVTRFQEGRFYLSHTPDGFVALYQKCTHLGCTVPWKPEDASEDDLANKGRFNCPCHGSIFNRYGVRKAGPAPRPLDIFPVSIVDGKVVVDTDPNKAIQRSAWDPKHAVKA
ncbi:MAG: ubiquinol-cytochrome c reductase iron-sulfur subunit [Chloroflexota bacterium]|nr:MAG: ubiquinol-cytochrome c reductase iron-sulfur subunit [Chloroflexota bacterium]